MAKTSRIVRTIGRFLLYLTGITVVLYAFVGSLSGTAPIAIRYFFLVVLLSLIAVIVGILLKILWECADSITKDHE